MVFEIHKTLSPEAPGEAPGEALSIDLFFIRINTLKDGTTFPLGRGKVPDRV